MAEKKVLLEVGIKMTDAIRELGKLRTKMDAVREAQKAVDRSTQEGQAEYARLGIELGVLKKQYASLEKSVSQTVRIDRAKEGSLEALKLKLSNLTAEYDKLSRTEREAASGRELQGRIKQLSDEIRGQEEAMGDWRRNVGHYEKATAALKGELADLLNVLKNIEGGGKVLDATAGTLSKQADDLKQRISEIELAIRSVGDTQSEEAQQMNTELKSLKNQLSEVYGGLEQLGENQSMDGLADSVKAFTASIGMIVASMSVGTNEGKEYEAVMKRLAKVSAALQAIQALSEATRKKSAVTIAAINLLQKIGIDQTKAQMKAESALNIIRGKGNILTKTAAAVQWAWNAALAANPVMAVVLAVSGLIVVTKGLVSWLGESESAAKRAEKAQADYEKQLRGTEDAINRIAIAELNAQVTITARYAEEIQSMQRAGATKEQIAKKMAEMEREQTAASQKAVRDRLEEERKEMQHAKENYNVQLAYYNELIRKKGEDAEATQEQMKKMQEALDAYTAKTQTFLKTEVEINTSITQSAADAADKQQAALDKAYDRAVAHFDRLQKLRQAQAKLKGTYIYDEARTVEENNALKFQSDAKYAADSFALQQRAEREKLELQLRYGKLSRKEYAEASAALRKQQDVDAGQFQIEQLAQTEEFARQMRKTAIDLAGGKDLDGQIADMRAQYAAAAKAIKEDTTMAADERAFYLRKLSMREAEETKQLRLSANEETNKKILEQTEELYRNDLRQFSESAVEQVQLEIDKQKQIIAARKAAGLDTRAEEQQLAKSEATLRGAQLDRELQMAWRNADEQYRIKREYLEKELAAADLSAERRAALEEELTNLTVENNQRKIASVEQWAGAAMSLASEVSNLMSALGDAEVQKAEKNNSKEKAALDKRLKAGVISQKDYDKQVAALDADLDAKKAKIAREQAKREKVMSIFQIGLNTAAAIMKIWAEVPKVDFGASTIALTALVSAIGALQLATAVATPLPMARKGGRIEGATHEQGGVLVNTENEERIISSAPAKAFPELLNLISYIGKHGGGIPETGYAARMMAAERSAPAQPSTLEIDYDRLAAAVGDRVAEGFRDTKIYLSLTELHDAEKEYARIENSAKM